jgi:hypothetical protein
MIGAQHKKMHKFIQPKQLEIKECASLSKFIKEMQL